MSFSSYYTYHDGPIVLPPVLPFLGAAGKIGLIELGGTFKKPSPNVHKVYIDETLVQCKHARADAEIVSFLAPQAQIYAYVARNTYDGLYRALHRAIEDECVAIVLGWAAPESPSQLRRFDGLFREARQANIFIFAAMSEADISFPASRPCVYACGPMDLKSDYEQILSYGGNSAMPPVWAAYVSQLTRRQRKTLKESLQGGDVPSNAQITIDRALLQEPIATPTMYFETEGAIWGPAPLTVTFYERAAPPVHKRLWSFGDGATSSAQHPTHIYTKTGCYDVTLQNANGVHTKKYLIRVF